MKVLYVFAHPRTDSFNALLHQNALEKLKDLNYELDFSNLYETHFNPIASWKDFEVNSSQLSSQYFLAQQEAYTQHTLSSDIVKEIEKVKRADHIFFQFPLWWFSVPAILKGWFDRVLVKGFAYDAGKIFGEGLLQGKTASLILSTQSAESAYQPSGVHGATIESFLHSIHHTLRFVGIQPKSPHVIYAAFDLSDERVAQEIYDLNEYLKNFSNQS